MLILILLRYIVSIDHYIYISNDGSDENDGSYDHPLNASNFPKIRESITSLTPEGTDHTHLVFKEGIYQSGGWSIMGWDYNKDKIKRITIESEEGKRATIQSSSKITGWVKSQEYPNLWKTNYSAPFSQLFVGDTRATLCRMPKKWKYGRFYGYEFHEDPSNSDYYLRYLYVQEDCIKMLEKMTDKELHASEIVVHYWWYTDVHQIVDFNSEKKYIITRIPKTEEKPETISESSYFFIQGAFPAITEPGEYYQHPDGILYYYPRQGEDMTTIEVNIPNSTDNFQTLSFNDVPNLTIKNLNFYFTNKGIGGYNFDNFLIENCEFKHVRTAFSILFAKNSMVDHCFIEDTARDGCGFDGQNFTLQNSIIRHIGVIAPFGFAVNFWTGCNYTYILNNDISDGATSLLFFGANNEYDVETFKRVVIENNHLHHAGYGIVDDLAAMFFGRHPRGVIVNHNKIHDFYTNNYCGNGIYPDTGSSGTKITNNLVYNLSHSAFNLNYGKEHDVSNNIMALCRAGFSFGGYRTDSYTLNIHNNIVFLNRDESYPAEGPLLNNDVVNYFNNNIYYKSGGRNVTMAGISFDEWREKGYDTNSLIIDPLFTDPEHGDFTFKSKENADKIGFKEFNMSFGVYGDEEWIKRTENYEYHDPVVRSKELPIIGFESFENGEDTYFIRRGSMNMNPPCCSIGITQENAFSGSHSFKVQHIQEPSSYSFNFPTYFRNGTAEFTMMVLMNKDSDFIFDFGLGGWIFMKDGLLRFVWTLGDIIGSYPIDKWFKFGVRANVGDAIKEKGFPKYTLIVDDNETEYETSNENFRYIDHIIITSNGKGTAYFDDFNSTTTQYVEPFFADFIDAHQDGKDNNDSKNGLNTGQKVGIAIGVIAFVAICAVIVVIIMMKSKKQNSDIENNKDSTF